MRKVGNRFVQGLGALAALLPIHAARSQDVSASPEAGAEFDRNRTVAVLDRNHPGFEERGHRIGGFILLPRIEVAGLADDNVLARPTNREGDVAAALIPAVEARSLWARHQVVVSASGVLKRFARLDSENADNYDLRLRGRYDATGQLSLTALAGFRRNTERRSDPGTLRNSIRPVTYTTVTGGGRLAWQVARLRLLAEAEAARIAYEDVRTSDGAVIVSSVLDRNQSRFSARADYALTPDLSLLAVGTLTNLDFDRSAAALGVDRTSRKVEALAGVSFEFTDLVRGEVALGYVSQRYRRAPIPDFSGFGGRVELTYFPTRLTQVRAEVSRTVREAGNPIAPSFIRTRAQVGLDHELYRRLVISAVADLERNRYELPARKERRYHAGVGARYLVNRHVSLIVRYDHLRVDTRPSTIGRRFTENAVSVGVLFKP